MIRAGHIELFVEDPLTSKDFYEKVLGATVADVQNGEFVWLALGGMVLLLRPGSPGTPIPTYQGAPCGFVLYTDDLEGTRQELAGRGLEFRGTDGSDRCLTFTDPDGNWFQLVDPGDH